MSLPHALLTALIETPCSGMELAGRFERSIAFYWHATHQQIYRDLARLEEAGWVKATPVESARGRKKEYRVVAGGRAELRRWVRESSDPEPLRNELMLRLLAETALGPSGVDAEVERHLKIHQARLALYRDIEKRRFAATDPSRATAVAHLILKKGILLELMWIDWCHQALGVLRQKYPTA